MKHNKFSVTQQEGTNDTVAISGQVFSSGPFRAGFKGSFTEKFKPAGQTYTCSTGKVTYRTGYVLNPML